MNGWIYRGIEYYARMEWNVFCEDVTSRREEHDGMDMGE
jgi:hypothetical protein